MLDETMILETPPLYHCYGRQGQQVEVPVTGSHAKRVLHGAINVRSGDVAFLITDVWDQAGRTFQCGEGWHSNEKTVRFGIPSPRVPKETAARCYAYTIPYTTMIPLCNVY